MNLYKILDKIKMKKKDVKAAYEEETKIIEEYIKEKRAALPFEQSTQVMKNHFLVRNRIEADKNGNYLQINYKKKLRNLRQ